VEDDGDHIRLTVPATAAAARITRVGAAGLATRAGFTYREVEQMRLAVNEATALLSLPGPNAGAGNATGPGAGDRLVVVYSMGRDSLDVEVVRVAADNRPAPPAPVPELAALLLDACVDGWEVSSTEGRVVLHMRRTRYEEDDDHYDGDGDG
jgi:serine/threonine-protein kinase RsbW